MRVGNNFIFKVESVLNSLVCGHTHQQHIKIDHQKLYNTPGVFVCLLFVFTSFQPNVWYETTCTLMKNESLHTKCNNALLWRLCRSMFYTGNMLLSDYVFWTEDMRTNATVTVSLGNLVFFLLKGFMLVWTNIRDDSLNVCGYSCMCVGTTVSLCTVR